MTFEEVIKEKGRLIYANKGISMRPLLREGKDLMVIEKITRPLEKYDAVLFKRPGVTGRGEYVLHRIMKVLDEHTYYIIGDNCAEGEIVKRDNILGILTAVQRGEKMIRVSDTEYQAYVKIWWAIYPVRRVFLKGRGFAHALYRKLKRMIKRGSA